MKTINGVAVRASTNDKINSNPVVPTVAPSMVANDSPKKIMPSATCFTCH